MFKKARKHYTVIPAPSCDYDNCQDTITNNLAQSPNSGVNRRD